MSSQARTRCHTANEFLTLDQIDVSTGQLEGISFLYEAARGAIVVGAEGGRFLIPRLSVDGRRIPIENCEAKMLGNWIPCLSLSTQYGVLEITYLTPPARRGMVVNLEFRTALAAKIGLEVETYWSATTHVTDIFRRMNGTPAIGVMPGHRNQAYLAFRSAWPVFGLGLAAPEGTQWELAVGDSELSGMQELTASPDQPVHGHVTKAVDAELGEVVNLTLAIGIGIEAGSGVACAQDLLEQGWSSLLERSLGWLDERKVICDGPAEELSDILNENLLFNYFYSQGVTVDSERMVLTSSRSPRFRQTASYKDRECCLYSLPAVLLIDPSQARRMLEYVFSVQLRNAGLRSRYMDGVTHQPGFALDALVTPIRALWMYVELTDDLTILFDQAVQLGVNRILEHIEHVGHPSIPLYSTLLGPDDKPVHLKYLTYSNALVWRALADLSDLYNRIRDIERSHETDTWARQMRSAILEHFVVNGPDGPMFCHSADLEGNIDLGSDPEGNLLLLTYLEFCKPDFYPYRNTVKWLKSQEERTGTACPNLMKAATQLLAGNNEGLELIMAAGPDDGFSCPGDGSGGQTSGNTAWAACAGYVSFALVETNEQHLHPPVLQERSRQVSRISRTTLRPGVGWI